MSPPGFRPTSDLTLRLEHIAPDENRRRYYELGLGRSLFFERGRKANETNAPACEETMFGAEILPITLTRRARSLREPPHSWGLIDRPGREQVESHRSLTEAEAALDRPGLLRKPSLSLWRAKARRGYATLEQGA